MENLYSEVFLGSRHNLEVNPPKKGVNYLHFMTKIWLVGPGGMSPLVSLALSLATSLLKFVHVHVRTCIKVDSSTPL